MTTPELCLFDLGGVAARFVPERRLPELARLLGSDGAEVESRIWSSGRSRRFDEGEFELPGMAEELSAAFGVPVGVDELVRVWCLAFEPDASVLALARRVARSTRVGLLTNNPPAIERGLSRHLPEIADGFEPRLFSCSLGVRKPDPEIFARVERGVGIAAEGLALVDDSLANVSAARERGWAAIPFSTPERLGAELEARGWIGH
ncbi:MAG: HAD family phosphatase [Myxococcota bacterium]|nr:HAD family phosphatase [Myxococcota bacterium]